MAKYFNTSKGSLAVVLRSGASASLPGKAWTVIPAHEEGSEDVIRAVKRGFLVRSAVADEEAPAPADKSSVVTEKAAVEQPVVETKAAPVVEENVSTESVDVVASVEELAASKETVSEKTSESRRRKV